MARTEKFEATRPDGTVVVVTRNIDTGEQTVVERGAPAPATEAVAEGEAPVDIETGAEPESESEPEPAKRKPGRPKKSE